MSEENTAAVAEEQVPTSESAIPADNNEQAEPAAAEQAPSEDNNQLPPPPEEIPVPAAEQPSDQGSQEAPADDAEVAEAKKAIKISVNPNNKTQPRKRVTFNPNDAQAKKAWVAQKHQEQQDSLIKNGYSPTATIAIMRYMAQNHGYEQKNAKDHLVFTFERLARSIKYSIDLFDQNMSSMLAIMIIDINGHLNDRGDLLRLPSDESKQYVTDVIDHVWKSSGGNSMGTDMQRLKEYVKRALNLKFADGYAARAKYFFECVIDVTMKTIDPFDGLFHTERLEIPPEVRKIMHLPEKKQYPKVQCPKCGHDMKWIFSIHKHICVYPMCEDYRPPREKRQRPDGDQGGERQERRGKPWQSGKKISTKSGSDRFAAKYGKFNRPPQHAVFGPKDAGGKPTKTLPDNNPFKELDKLKLPKEQPTEPTTPPPEVIPTTTAGEPDVQTTSSGNPPDGAQA